MNEVAPTEPRVLAEVGLVSQPEWVVLIACAWVGVGLVVATSLARRGHDRRPLLALGVAFGPFLYGYARTSLRQLEQAARPVLVREPDDHGGELRVLVAVVGEPTSVVDALPVLRLFAPHAADISVGRLVNYDVARSRTGDDREEAVRALETAAVFLHDLAPGLVLIPGTGRKALRRFAAQQGVDVILVAGDDVDDADARPARDGRSVTVISGWANHVGPVD